MRPARVCCNSPALSDVLSRTKGQTRTTINYAAATFNALKNMNTTRVTQEQRERLHITYREGECMSSLLFEHEAM